MKKRYLFLMALFSLTTLFTGRAFAADPPKSEYDRAMAAIEDDIYYITTTTEDGVKFYITTTGTLTTDKENEDAVFSISKVSGGGLYDIGLNINPGTGYHFSNTNLQNSKAILHPENGAFALTNENDRNDWERQVPFMNEEGKIAIRSCNVAYGESSWNDAGRTFWTYEVEDIELATPCYTYDPAYVWEFEAPEDQIRITNILNGIFNQYDECVYDSGEGESMNMGTDFGQHADIDSWNEFFALLMEVQELLDNKFLDPDYDLNSDPDAITLEYARNLERQADSLYQAILDSEVPYAIPQNGYYRIIAHNRYKSTYDESGFVDKAIAASYDKDHIGKAVYGTLRRDLANYLWKLTQVGDSIMIQNAGMGTYISSSLSDAGDNKVVMTQDIEDASCLMFDYAAFDYVEPDGIGDDKDIFAIRLNRSPRDPNGRYFHQMNHASAKDENSPWGTYGTDSGTEQELGFWRRTYDNDLTRADAWASEWFLEYVDDAEAEQIIDDFEIFKNHDVLVAENNALRAEVLAAMTTAKDVIRTGLIKTASQMSSPYSQNDLGTSRDGGDLSAGVLIDGDKSTYWHSAWQNTPEEPHYIQIADMEDMVDLCELYVCDRNTTSGNWPNEFTLYGSNDPEAEAEAWEEIAVMPLQTGASVENTIPFNSPTSYKYVRVTATNKDNYFWHAAELQIFTVRDNPNSQFAALGEIAEALESAYNDNMAIDDASLTTEDYEALLKAYKAFLAGMVDPTELRAALAAYKNVTKGVIEGTEPGQWKNTAVADEFDDLYAEIEAYDKAGRYNAAQNHKYAVMLKAMAKSVQEGANTVNADTWYRIMFPTEEMYTDYGFALTTPGGDSKIIDNPNMWGYYVTSGIRTDEIGTNDEGEEAPTGNYYLEFVGKDDVREGMSMYFANPDDIADPDVSMFRFVEREQETTDFSDLFKGVKENMLMALDMSQTFTRGDALITSAAQLSSNASDSSEGQHIEYLIDGSINTYWHSDYHKNTLAPGYIQVAFDEPVSGYIQVDVTRRQNASNGHIVRMYIVGSNDGENWTNVGYLETPFTNQNESVSSLPVYIDGSYSYLRFILTNRYGTDGGGNTEFDPFAQVSSADEYNSLWTYFHAAEFQIYPLTVDKALNASGNSLFNAFTAANKIIFKDATAEDVAAAVKAYRTYRDSFNSIEGKTILPNGAEKAAPQYAIQNKATGLFINCKDANNANNSLELVPSYFEITAPGFERSFLHAKRLDGTDCSYLHAQNFDHRFVTWNNTQVEYNSGLVIREAEAFDAKQLPDFSFYKDIKPGRIYGWCNSVTVTPTPTEECVAYTPLGQFTDEEEGTFLALKEIKTIPAGEPAFYIYGDTTVYDPEDDYVEPIAFTIPASEQPVVKGKMVNGVLGSLVNHTLEAHEIYFSGNHAVCIHSTGYYLAGPCVALDIDNCPQFDPYANDYDFAIALGQAAKDAADGVENVPAAIEKISQPGNVYSMDGKLLRSGATLNSLKALGRGMYILNGVKVVVK